MIIIKFKSLTILYLGWILAFLLLSLLLCLKMGPTIAPIIIRGYPNFQCGRSSITSTRIGKEGFDIRIISSAVGSSTDFDNQSTE